MAAIGSVDIGSRHIDIHAFTGDVISTARSSDTETVRDDSGHVASHRKWTYNHFVVKAPDGATRAAVFDTRQADPSQGELVTLFWGVVGAQESEYLSLYQHSSEKLGVVWNTRNDLAGPAFLRKQWVLSILAILFLAIFIATSGVASVIVLGLTVGLWYWLFRRRQKLVDAVKAAIPNANAQYASLKQNSAVA